MLIHLPTKKADYFICQILDTILNLKPFNRLNCMFTNNDICVVYTYTYIYCLFN